MSDNGKNIKKYSAEDIRLYLEGKLLPDEMHAIEKAAMDDPFLTDALEGMELHLEKSGSSFEKDIDELKNRLKEKVKHERKTIFILNRNTWLNAAAIFLVIIGGIAIVFSIVEKNPPRNVDLAKNEKLKDSGQKEVVMMAPGKADTNYFPKEARQKKVPIPSMRSKKENSNKEEIISRNEEEEKQPQALTPAIPERQPDNAIIDTLRPFELAKAPKSRPATEDKLQGKVAGITVSNRKEKEEFITHGRVIDEHGQPVTAAVVNIKNKKISVVTDTNGVFKIENKTRDSTINVVVNVIGYETADASLNSIDSSRNIVTLKPSEGALSEVVVSAYGVSKKQRRQNVSKVAMESRTYEKIMPAGGWEHFDEYINKNKKISAADSVLKGREEISFTVDEQGRPSSIIIIRSLSPAHDAEAIRLINEGPAWIILKGKKRNVSLVINF